VIDVSIPFIELESSIGSYISVVHQVYTCDCDLIEGISIIVTTVGIHRSPQRLPRVNLTSHVTYCYAPKQ